MVIYTQWIHSHNQFGFIQKFGEVLQDRTLSCFVIDFVMLISLMYCERLILWIQPYPIPFFECELDAGGTIHIFLRTCARHLPRRCPARAITQLRIGAVTPTPAAAVEGIRRRWSDRPGPAVANPDLDAGHGSQHQIWHAPPFSPAGGACSRPFASWGETERGGAGVAVREGDGREGCAILPSPSNPAHPYV
jgi:hypothetical protein